MNEFRFDLNQRVALSDSKEKGTIVGRSSFIDGEPQYLVRFVNANGCQCREWFMGGDIRAMD